MFTNKLVIFIAFCQLTTQIQAGFRFGSSTSTIDLNSSGSYLVLNTDIPSFSGTLKSVDNSVGRISGASNIIFGGGTMKTGSDTEIVMTGSFDPATQNDIVMQNGTFLELSSGKPLNKAIIVPSNTTASLYGPSILKQPITLTDSSSVLHLSLLGRLDQNINLNGGTIILDGDLAFTVNAKILGGGTINVSGKKLMLPGGDFADGEITYDNAQDVTLTANTTYTTAQSITGATADFLGDGFNCVLAPANGRIRLNVTAQTVYFINTHFKNIGGERGVNSFGIFDILPTATAFFQNCTFDLVSSYTHNQGTMVFRQGNKILTHGYNFCVNGTAFMRLDGSVLEYETFDKLKTNPFIFSNKNAQFSTTSDGIIRSTTALNSEFDMLATTDVMKDDFTIADDSIIRIINATPGTPKAVSLDGSGYQIIFPKIGSNLFNLDANVNLTMTNILFRRFNKDVFSYGDANASIKFGTGCIIDLASNTTLGSSDKAWQFIGNSTIQGTGASLTINSANKITVAASTTLTISGLTLFINDPAAISMTNSTSKIIFQNCQIKMGVNGMTVSAGNIDIVDNVGIWGGDPAIVDGHSAFTFSSPGQFKILSLATLTINRYTDFYYAANPSSDAGIVYNQKRHFKINDPSATLELKGGALHSTTTGLALDYGRFLVSDSSKLISEGSYGTEAEFGSSLDWYHCPGCTLSVTGSLSYKSTTFP